MLCLHVYYQRITYNSQHALFIPHYVGIISQRWYKYLSVFKNNINYDCRRKNIQHRI
jgi:hypothetical protein